MGAYYRVQAEFPRSTGLSADKVVNTWYFDGDLGNTTPAEAAVIVGRLKTFYTATAQYLTSLLSGVVNYKVYDLEQSEPRTPIYEDTQNLGTLTSADFPAEVAICCSFQADKISGENQRRRRGRIFLGPVGTASRGAITLGDVIVLATCRTTIGSAMHDLAAATSPKWAVFSPTEAGPPAGESGAYTAGQLGPAFNDVTNGWVDDRYDIQRRRGSKSTARSLWTD